MALKLSKNGNSLKDKYFDNIIIYFLPLLSFIIWLYVLATQELRLTDYGIFDSLSIWFYVAVILLQISFFYSLFYSSNIKIIWLHTSLIIIYLFFTITILEGTPRVDNGWDKFSFVDYIVRNDALNRDEMWYHMWPSTFIFSSFIIKITNIESESFLLYFPIMMQFLLLPILIALFRKVLKDNKKAWLATWIFYYANWINQDHFTSQNFSLLLLAINIFIFMMIFTKKEKRDQYLLFSVLIISSAITIINHLLTTVAYIPMFIVLIIRYRHSLLIPKKNLIIFFVLGILVIIAWSYFARGFLIGWTNRPGVGIDSVEGSVAEYSSRILQGNMGHKITVMTRIIYTGIFLLLALISTLSLITWKKNRNFFTEILNFIFEKKDNERRTALNMCFLVLCAAFPIVIFLYGGEILQRFFLFSLIPISIIIGLNINKRKFKVLVIAILFASTPLYILAHYGNERTDYFTRAHIDGVYYFYDHVPFDNTFVASHSAAQFTLKEKYTYNHITNITINYNRTQYVWFNTAWVEMSIYFYNNESAPIEFRNRLEQGDYDKIYSNEYFELFYKNVD